MSKALVTILGKTIKTVASLRGGGSALPGLIVERIDPDFIKKSLDSLPMGTVVISGTNGKTTTTKMVVELLKSQGVKVFTNKTGSNFTRGVAAALLGEVDFQGKLDADIAVLELDEAHAVNFVKKIPPRYSLILNVMRDQLDRFGEIDHTAKLLQAVVKSTKDTVVLNRDDYRIAKLAEDLPENRVRYFGLDEKLIEVFPTDDDLHANKSQQQSKASADVTLVSLSDKTAEFFIDGKNYNADLKLSGIYNVFNAAAALTLVRSILGSKTKVNDLLKVLSDIESAFGRGEVFSINSQPLELVLVKNPSGFRLGLRSFDPSKYCTMIAINDNYADGRDMSWLWDVDFSSLKDNGVNRVSGIRAYDMALRLYYDDVKSDITDTNIKNTLEGFISSNPNKPKRIYCTYTAMLEIRKLLSKFTEVEQIK